MGGQVRDRGHDLGHAGLVVGAEQGVAAGGDDVVAALAASTGMSAGSSTVAARELDARAVVGAVDDRLDAGAGRVGRDVDVGDQPDACGTPPWPAAWRTRSRVRRARRPRGRSPAALDEHAGEVELARRARPARRDRGPTGCRRGRSAGTGRGRPRRAPGRGLTCRRRASLGSYQAGWGWPYPAGGPPHPQGGSPYRAEAGLQPSAGPRAVGESFRRSTPPIEGPGDHMNTSLLHLTHAKTVDQQRLAVRRPRRRS